MTAPVVAHVGEPIPDAEVSRMGVTLARLATLGAKEVLRFRVWTPGEHSTEVVSPWNGQWGITTAKEHGKRMAAKYPVREHGPLDLRDWDAATPLHKPPQFYRDQFEHAYCMFDVHAHTLQLRAEPVAYAMRAAGKFGPWLELLRLNAGVSSGVAIFYDTDEDKRGELLSLAPVRLLRPA